MKKKRPTWEEYFLGIAKLVSRRSTCLRRSVGAVIVKGTRILTTGYNGAPAGLKHCEEIGCIRKRLNIPSGERHELCRGSHAEENAIIQAACYGVSISGATLYVTHQPCSSCAKSLINAGIEKIVIFSGYPDRLAREMLDEAGVEIILKQKTI
jgi:dCMP deaminase